MEQWLVQSSPGLSLLPGEVSRASNTAAAARQCDGGAVSTQDGGVPTHGGVVPTRARMAGRGVAGVTATLHQVSWTQLNCIPMYLPTHSTPSPEGFNLTAFCGKVLYTAITW